MREVIKPSNLKALFSKQRVSCSIAELTQKEEGTVSDWLQKPDTRIMVSTVGVLKKEAFDAQCAGQIVDLGDIDNYITTRHGPWYIGDDGTLAFNIEHDGHVYSYLFELDRKTATISTSVEALDPAGNKYYVGGGYQLEIVYTTLGGRPKDKPNGKIPGRRIRPGQTPWDRIGRR